jgi:protein-tyrosine phosphatase
MRGMQVPSDAQMERALAVITDDAAGPVFVHCQRGADRTGVVLACYRVQHDGWGKKKALSEARKYGMSWYQIQLQYYVLRYDPRHLDADLDRENDADEVTSSSGALN